MYQGSPLCAMIFIVYFDRLPEIYGRNILGKHNFSEPSTTKRNGRSGPPCARQCEMARIRYKGSRKTPNLNERWARETPIYIHVYADDDLAVKTKNGTEIYPKHATFDTCIKQLRISINWKNSDNYGWRRL